MSGRAAGYTGPAGRIPGRAAPVWLYLLREINNIKTILGENLFDKSLLNETTEPIYDYIIEKIYQMPEYLEDVPMNKQKLKIAFNKFYENLTIHTN